MGANLTRVRDRTISRDTEKGSEGAEKTKVVVHASSVRRIFLVRHNYLLDKKDIGSSGAIAVYEVEEAPVPVKTLGVDG